MTHISYFEATFFKIFCLTYNQRDFVLLWSNITLLVYLFVLTRFVIRFLINDDPYDQTLCKISCAIRIFWFLPFKSF